jgi:hypothetical protein
VGTGFPKRSCSDKKIDRGDDSKKSHPDLVSQLGQTRKSGCNEVPAWAVDEAVRRWHRGECGDEYNYSFAPAPGALRRIALQELEPAMATLRSLKLMLSAAPSFADAERLAAAPPGAIIVRPTGK